MVADSPRSFDASGTERAWELIWLTPVEFSFFLVIVLYAFIDHFNSYRVRVFIAVVILGRTLRYLQQLHRFATPPGSCKGHGIFSRSRTRRLEIRGSGRSLLD